MSEAWTQSILQTINRGKVTQVAVCQLDGSLLTASPECRISETEVQGLLSSFIGPVCMFKIYIGGTLYNCHRVLQNIVFGRTETTESKIFTAILTTDVLIIGFADESSPGSCIHELQLLERDLDSGELIVSPLNETPPLISLDIPTPRRKVLV